MTPDTISLLLVLAVLGIGLTIHIRMKMRRMRLRRRLSSYCLREGELKGWARVLSSFALPLASLEDRTRIGHRLASAGFRKIWCLDAFLVGQLLVLLIAGVGAWVWLDMGLSTIFSKPFDSLKFLILLYIAYRLPDWLLSEQIKRRRAKIRVAVPKAIDLMTICVDSGVSLEEAFNRVGREVEDRAPEVATEFRITRSEMLVMDRMESLKRMEKRSGVREIESLAGSLLQSIRYGTPLAEALRTIATDSRLKQVSELEEKAGKISASVGVPLVVLILFPLVGLIAAPAVISFIRTF